jgi:antagonist of KipI
MWHAVYVRAGQTVTFGQRHNGARAYLAISGGLAQPTFLGSQATYLKGKFGGVEGRALQAGDQIPLTASSCSEPVSYAGKSWPQTRRTPYTHHPTIRVILGPQDAYFTPAGIDTFLKSTYTLTPNADRMGMRFAGPHITHKGPTGITSDGIVTGSIQVPPDGQPIIMMVDHQTTGGYPKIATVLQTDIPLLAQCLPGDSVTFQSITLPELGKHPC